MISCARPSTPPSNGPACTHPDDLHHEAVHTLGEIRPLCDRVTAAVVAAGYSNYDAFTVRLAVEEAVINAVKHGHRADPTKTVRLSYSLSPDQVLVHIEDEGPGFDPSQVADPLNPENVDRTTGRGLLLMRHYMSWIKYNERGNRVTLCKCRSR
jgi:serine/threonine-protein kinase RsbW